MHRNSYQNPKSILVTGGAGFIGSHVVEQLVAEGHDVTVLDCFSKFYDPEIKRANISGVRDAINLVEGDVADRQLVDRVFEDGKFDTVIHLAARAGVRPSIEMPELYLETNINGTFHLLEASRRHGVRKFIFASSSSVYGLNRKMPFSETDRIDQTISPYAATKLAGEQLCSNYAHLYGLQTVCLRFFTVYGPRQRPDLAISKFTRLISEGQPIQRYGDGSTARDYTYVLDILQGIMGALHYDGPIFDIFNLGGSQTVTLNELIETIEGAVGKRAIVKQIPDQPGDVPKTSADISKARRLLGYDPETPIRDGVPKYVEWFLGVPV
jgi:UDP-glucuronate 4-epimerase